MRNIVFEPSIPDRIISALSYLTAGWGGLIYLVILYFPLAKVGLLDFSNKKL